MKAMSLLLLLSFALLGCDDKDIQPGLARLGTVKENVGEIRVLAVDIEGNDTYFVNTYGLPAQDTGKAQLYIYESEIRIRMPYTDLADDQQFLELKDSCTSQSDITKLYNLIEGASICKQNPTDEPIFCTLKYSGYINVFGQATDAYQISLDACEQGVRRFCSEDLLNDVKTFTDNVVNSIETNCFDEI